MKPTIAIANTLKRANLIGVALVILSVLATQGVAWWMSRQQLESAHVINIAGRQRMLSQRIPLLCQAVVHDEETKSLAMKAMDTWELSHSYLKASEFCQPVLGERGSHREEFQLTQTLMAEATQNARALFALMNSIVRTLRNFGKALRSRLVNSFQ